MRNRPKDSGKIKNLHQIRNHISSFPNMWFVFYKLADLGWSSSENFLSRRDARIASKQSKFDSKIVKYKLC